MDTYLRLVYWLCLEVTMEINVKEARGKIGSLIDRAEEGEEIIILRRDKRVARLVPIAKEKKLLPALGDFRDSIRVTGDPLSTTVVSLRSEERY
jgi:prevent-host-death family protein